MGHKYRKSCKGNTTNVYGESVITSTTRNAISRMFDCVTPNGTTYFDSNSRNILY